MSETDLRTRAAVLFEDFDEADEIVAVQAYEEEQPADSHDASRNEALASDAAVLAICAPAGGGKTEFLLEKVMRLVGQGTAAESILVVLASAQAAETFAKRLRDAQVVGVKVVTPYRLCCELLQTAEAMEARGHAPRVLAPVERAMLLEDVAFAVAGLDVRSANKIVTLYEMKRSALEPVSASAGGLAAKALAALEEQLRIRGCMLHGELSSAAMEFLEGEGASLCEKYETVLIDDVQSMSIATMKVCESLCKGQLVAMCDPAAGMTLSDAYPNIAGFNRLAERNGAVKVVLKSNADRARSVRELSQALRHQLGAEPLGNELPQGMPDEKGEARDEFVVSVKWRRPEDEAVGIARMARRYANDAEVELGEVYVAVPNRTWARLVANGFAKRAMDASVLMGDVAAGSAKEEGSSGYQSAKALALLNLAAQPQDVAAWRTWIALGDETYRAAAWDQLVHYARERGLDAVSALAALSEYPDAFECARELANLYVQGVKQAEYIGQLQGLSLAHNLMRESEAMEELFAKMKGDEDAKGVFASAIEMLFDPIFPDTLHNVKIGTLRCAHGTNPSLLIIAGAVDGLLPAEKGAGSQQQQLRVLYCSTSEPHGMLAFSRSQKCDVEFAQRNKMKPARFKQEKGEKLAMLKRSMFIEACGDAAPGEVSGEQFLMASL